MNDRYTSPETSRALAEAGLEQKKDGYFYCEDGPGLVQLTLNERKREEWNAEDASARYSFGDDIRKKYYVRALDLTDILAELTRPRPEEADARPLCVTWELKPAFDLHGAEAYAFAGWVNGKGFHAWKASPVEAAALVLLALLRERRKPAVDCGCVANDAWRCASARRLAGVVSCQCPCHRERRKP